MSFEVKELRDRTEIGWTAGNIDKVSIDDFPFAISKKHPPFAFGAAVILVGGENYDEAKHNAQRVFKALQLLDLLESIV